MKNNNNNYFHIQRFISQLILTSIITLSITNILNAANEIEIDDTTKKIYLSKNIAILEDKNNSYTIKDILSPTLLAKFKMVKSHSPNYGYSQSTYWARIILKNISKKKSKKYYFIELGYPLIDKVDLYNTRNNKIISTIKTGDTLHFNTRQINHKNFIFRIKLKKDDNHILFFKINSKGSVRFPLTLYSTKSFVDKLQSEIWEYGFFYGILAVMIIYNLFLYLLLKDKNYLYYIFFALSYSVFQITLDGYLFQHLLPGNAGLANFILPISGTFCSITIIIFGNSFLNTKKYLPLFHKIIQITLYLFSSISFITLIFSYRLSIYLVTTFISISSIAYLYAGYSIFFKGYKSARFYITAWSSLLICTVIFSLNHMGFFPMNYFTDHGIKIGIILLFILLSFALGDQINREKTEKYNAKKEALLHEQKARKTEQEALEFQKKNAEMLEKEVQERTHEYKETYERLNKAYSDMKEDLLLAKTIQDKILPKNISKVNDLNFHIEYLPLIEIGGDIYDVYKIGSDTVRIFLADATGHGIVASLITMLIKNEYDKLKDLLLSPSEVFSILNHAFVDNYNTLNMFFTGIIIDINTKENKIIYASAGNPDQFLLQKNNVIALPRTGRAIGIMDDINILDEELPYKTGDKVFLYTDGLFEEFNQENIEYGEDRLKKIIFNNLKKPIYELIDIVIDDIMDFVDEAELNDDITIIGIE